MANEQTEQDEEIASFRPDQMVHGGGLPSDIDATLDEVRLVPFNYGGKSDKYVLAVRAHYTPDDPEIAPFYQHYSCGDLKDFVPSMDGKTAVDIESWNGSDDTIGEVEGVFAKRVGQKKGLNDNSNWAHFIGAAIDAGMKVDRITNDVRCFEGLHGHINRVPQKKRPGVPDRGDGREREILVFTKIDTATPATAGKAAPAKAAKAETNGKADIDDALQAAVLEVLAEADDNTAARTKLPALVVKKFAGADKAKALKRVSDLNFLQLADSGFTYDQKSDSVSLG